MAWNPFPVLGGIVKSIWASPPEVSPTAPPSSLAQRAGVPQPSPGLASRARVPPRPMMSAMLGSSSSPMMVLSTPSLEEAIAEIDRLRARHYSVDFVSPGPTGPPPPLDPEADAARLGSALADLADGELPPLPPGEDPETTRALRALNAALADLVEWAVRPDYRGDCECCGCFHASHAEPCPVATIRAVLRDEGVPDDQAVSFLREYLRGCE